MLAYFPICCRRRCGNMSENSANSPRLSIAKINRPAILANRSKMAGIAAAIILGYLEIALAFSQTRPAAPATPAPAVVSDPYGRDSPRGTALGFLRTAHSGKFSVAATYLQLSDGDRRQQGELLARQLRDLMDRAFTGHLQLLSDQP